MSKVTGDSRRDMARLDVSRHAARLFLKNGFDATSGDDIAAAAGISKRTVWRYFRSKEACVEPVLMFGELSFAALLRKWPRTESIETYLPKAVVEFASDADIVRDGMLAVRILAILDHEPALRSSWLMACHAAELQLIGIVADRAGRSPDDFEVRLCAAATAAAIRLVDEEISMAAINDGVQLGLDETTARIAAAIRTASILPICDPVA